MSGTVDRWTPLPVLPENSTPDVEREEFLRQIDEILVNSFYVREQIANKSVRRFSPQFLCFV